MEDKVTNTSSSELSLSRKGYSRQHGLPDDLTNFFILHEGPISVVDGKMHDMKYKKLTKKKTVSHLGESGWVGLTDKYWLASFIPDQSEQYSANYNYAIKAGRDKYQADFISTSKLIEEGGVYELTHHLFAGAKKVALLDKYESQYDIKLFDRAIDFGWFYILTKPIFNAMNFFFLFR